MGSSTGLGAVRHSWKKCGEALCSGRVCGSLQRRTERQEEGKELQFNCDLNNQKSEGEEGEKQKNIIKLNVEILLGMSDIKHLIDRRGIQCRSHVNSVAHIKADFFCQHGLKMILK